VKWLKRQKRQQIAWWNHHSLEEAVDQAKMDWQNARHLADMSEKDSEVEDAIYYLQLTEKRYMYLLNQAKQEEVRKQA
jgi:hypothetical protein